MKRALLHLSDAVLALALLWLLGLLLYQPAAAPACLPLLLAPLLRLFERKAERSEGKKRMKKGALARICLWSCIPAGAAAYILLPNPQPAAWQTPWIRAPHFERHNNKLVVTNIRDFAYRPSASPEASDHPFEMIPRYKKEEFDLGSIIGADFADCYWDNHTAVCHTMLSFHFNDGRRLVVSAETRVPEGEEQTALAGLYKRFGLIYLFGTEQDIFALRTNYRHERLYLYPLNITPEQAKELLLAFIERARRAEEEHTPYNTLTNNCSTTIVNALEPILPNLPWYRFFLPVHNGSIAKLLFNEGLILTARPGETFEHLRQRSLIPADTSSENLDQYSRAIRGKLVSPAQIPLDTKPKQC